MPLRFYDNNDWRTPTNVRIYDGSWNDVKVIYTYDLGVWKVVYPDPIIPDISVYSWGGSRNQANPALFDLSATFKTLNDDGTTLFAELFSGSSAVGTPIATQTVTPNNVSGPDNYFTATFTSSLYSSGTYCMRGTVKSITENSSSVTTVPLTVIYPTVSIQSYSVPNSTTFSVSWTSTNQNAWLVTIEDTSGNVVFASATDGPVNSPVYTIGTQTSYSGTISPPLLASTNYILKVSVESTNYKSDTASASFTSPAAQTSGITSYSTTETCSTIKVDWTTNSFTQSGVVSLYLLVGEALGGSEEFISSFSFTTQRTHTFTSLQLNSPYKIYISNVNYQGQSGPTQEIYTGTLAPSVTTPTNFTATSNFYGNGATLSWSASTGNCTSVTGYNVQYKLSSSGTWLTLVNGITATSANTTLYTTLTANTSYDFRVQATSNSAGSSTYATTTITTNNNPYYVALFSEPTATTFDSITMTAYLTNISGATVPQSGTTINFSVAESGRGSFSATSGTTNSSGWVSVTFDTNSISGPLNFTASSSGLVSGTDFTLVSLRTGQSVTLAGSGTNKGVSFTNNVYSALYSYTNAPGYPTVGSLESGDSYNNSQFDILTSRTRDARPTVSKSGTTATTTNTTYLANPLVSMSIRSSRPGYTTVDGPESSITASVNVSTRTYQWQQSLDNGATWSSSFNANFSNTTSQTMSWTSGINSRLIRCQVTSIFTNGDSDTATSTNTLTIP